MVISSFMPAKFKKQEQQQQKEQKTNHVRAQFPHFLSIFQQVACFLTLLMTFPTKFHHIWICLNLIVPKLFMIKNAYRSLWCFHTQIRTAGQ